MTTDQSSGSLARRPAHDSRGVEFNSARRALAWHGGIASLTSCEHEESPAADPHPQSFSTGVVKNYYDRPLTIKQLYLSLCLADSSS